MERIPKEKKFTQTERKRAQSIFYIRKIQEDEKWRYDMVETCS